MSFRSGKEAVLKKDSMKRGIRAGLVGMLAIVLAGCGASSMSTNKGAKTTEVTNSSRQEIASDVDYDEGGWMDENPEISEVDAVQDAADADGSAVVEGAAAEKIIRTYDLRVQTKSYDQTWNTVQQKVTELGGYVESSESSGQDGNRWCSLTLRIPADQAETFLAALGEAGTIVYQSSSTENVTLTYTDVQSHIDALKTEQETLMRLMEEADKLEDVLSIQSYLTDVRYELDSYESQMRVLENRVSYSTITVDIDEVERVTPQEEKGFFAESWAKLQDTMYDLGQTIRTLGIWFIGSLPVLILLGAAIAVVVVVIRKICKKGDKITMKKKEDDGK